MPPSTARAGHPAARSRLRGTAILQFLAATLPPAALALHPLANNDLPLHLAIGEWIAAAGRIPTADPFSCTAGGNAWVPHEWLAGVLFAAVERAAGAGGLVALAVILAGLLGLATWRVARALGSGDVGYFLASVPAWLVAAPRLHLRPHLLAWVLLFAVAWVLLAARRRPRLLLSLPLFLALWVNVHGSFPLGFALVAGDLLLQPRRHPLPRGTRLLALAGAASALLLQLHAWAVGDPLAGLRHALGLVGSATFTGEIGEWISPLVPGPFQRSIAFALSLPLLAAAALGALRAERAVPWSFRLLFAAGLVLYLRHQRFAALAALTALPFVPAAVPRFRRWSSPPRTASSTASLLALLPLALVLTWGAPTGWGEPPRQAGTGWRTGPGRLPLGEVKRLRELLERGEVEEGGVLCEYAYGGAIAWLGGGAFRPSFDSRNSVYGEALYRTHLEALEVDTTVPAAVEARLAGTAPDDPAHGADAERVRAARRFLERLLAEVVAVLLDLRDPRRRGLIARLHADPTWRAASVSRDGPVLFVRVR